MPLKDDKSKNGSKLALQTAIITAIIGPVALLVVQHVLEPRVIEQTRRQSRHGIEDPGPSRS
jgi:hypothetical protein